MTWDSTPGEILTAQAGKIDFVVKTNPFGAPKEEKKPDDLVSFFRSHPGHRRA